MNPNEVPGLKWILSGIVFVVFITIIYLCHPGRHVIRSEKKDRKREREMKNRRNKESKMEKNSKVDENDDDDDDTKTVQLDVSFTSQRSGDETDSETNDSAEPSADDMV